MGKVIMTQKQTRVRCSDEKFLEAVYSSKTYAEISEKTGQKLPSTIARYLRVKKILLERNIELPEMDRKQRKKTEDNTDSMVEIVNRLKVHHNTM